jgi:hypothetical protein
VSEVAKIEDLNDQIQRLRPLLEKIPERLDSWMTVISLPYTDRIDIWIRVLQAGQRH